jgi:thiamine-monophosphate kinase
VTTVRKDRFRTETQLIERITRAIPAVLDGRAGRHHPQHGVRLGIGDDAAVLAPSGRTDWVLTCDAFLEGVHFLASRHPPDSVGFKSLVRATSDVAAMGAEPRFFLLTLALPVVRTRAWLDEFLRGMARAARLLGLCLIGGDTKKYPAVSISITVLGEIAPGTAVPRSGARPGDIIYVSGRLGQAQLGLEIIRQTPPGALRKQLRASQAFRQLLQPHLYPRIRTELGAWLARTGVASAMIDISDGLSTDLDHVCVASEAGARLWAQRIPCAEIPAGQSKQVAKRKLDPLRMALHGGEDYELLFTVAPRHVPRLRKAPGFSDLRAIGEIVRGKQILLVGPEGNSRRLEPGGWDPFRKK